MKLTEEQIKRYARHIVLPEVGGKGQEKLLNAKVLCVGVGGLGSPISLYLAAAGVGTIGIIDYDVVDVSNLQRQVIYTTEDVGKSKAIVACERLKKLNPEVNAVPYQTKLTSENVFRIFRDYDIIVDGTDNFPARYLTNDACFFLRKPYVHGSIFRFEGHATVFKPGEGPCYRCLFPEPPPPDMVPSCQEVGVLGVTPGFIGVVQATEVIKLILGIGKTLEGTLLIYNALKGEIKRLKVKRDRNCVLCGETPKVKELIDYEEFCQVRV